MQWKKTLIVLTVPTTLALAGGGTVGAYAATPTPPAPTTVGDHQFEGEE